MSDEKVTFRGTSGSIYPFQVFSLDTDLKNIAAVYILTNRAQSDDGRNYHSFIYVGDTDALGDAIKKHKEALWPKEYGCNAICVHQENNEKRRSQKLRDIQLFYIPYIEASEPASGKIPTSEMFKKTVQTAFERL